MADPKVCVSVGPGGEMVDTSPSELVTTIGVEMELVKSSSPDVTVERCSSELLVV